MGVERRWTELPETRQAAAVGDYGSLLRVARTAARLTLTEAGERCGYSAATLSRIERGRQRLTDVTVLRRLAAAFDIPAELFGLAETEATGSRQSLSPIGRVLGEGAYPEVGDDPLRRRDVLGGMAGLVGSALMADSQALAAPPPRVVASLEDVLLGTVVPPGPVDPAQLRGTLARAWSDFRACRYARLSARLPQLVADATAHHSTVTGGRRSSAAATLARTYQLTTQVLLKLHEDAMAWSAMDRANQAARESEDPLLYAETARISAIVLRRTRHGQRAQQTLLSAAQSLDGYTKLTCTAEVTMYGRLLATAAYTAALADQRATAWELLHEADEAGRRCGSGEEFAGVDVALYRIGVARVLGDYGAAVEYARALRPEQLGNVERRARYWEDYALALHGRGAHREAYRALLCAERIAPQEVRYRPWAQQLTTALLAADRRGTLPDLRGFATRIGVAR
ncbi:helix-turn-helix transcriptional regulator [Micromonospora sp. NPDC051296]|uniref:helix-turn-helix domain-containing protein n=1 Tax=Micromonospora sp. NPDC051296 TaxID=3155046 RepID=UPI003413A61B